MNKSQLTAKEIEVLTLIGTAEYSQANGGLPEDIGESQTWAWDITDCFSGGARACGGVLSSLIKKGLADHCEDGEDSTTMFTEAGMKLYTEQIYSK